MSTALDYSQGPPTAAAIRQAGHVGVIRYAGTPGRRKNITRAEFQDHDRNGVGVALVFEDAEGDALKGRARGATAAQAIVADAAAIGFPSSRPLYFAVDQDITNQMPAVLEYFRGIRSVLGGRPAGVYGEADVLDAVIGAGLASYGWQTTGWSRGHAAKVRHLFQTLQQPYVGGVQVDINNILAADWGQHNAQEDDMPTADEVATAVWNKALKNYLEPAPRNWSSASDLLGFAHLEAGAMHREVGAALADLALKVSQQQNVPTAELVAGLLQGLLPEVKAQLADVEHLDENAVADRLAANLTARLAQ